MEHYDIVKKLRDTSKLHDNEETKKLLAEAADYIEKQRKVLPSFADQICGVQPMMNSHEGKVMKVIRRYTNPDKHAIESRYNEAMKAVVE